jgi:hypothetical protein
LAQPSGKRKWLPSGNTNKTFGGNRQGKLILRYTDTVEPHSFLVTYFGLKTDRLKKYLRPKEAQTGIKQDKTEKMQKRIFKLVMPKASLLVAVSMP